MTTYTVSGPLITTKKSFTATVKAGINVRMIDESITRGSPVVTLRDFQDRAPGFIFTVTNRRRSWFAQVEVLAGRKFKVS